MTQPVTTAALLERITDRAKFELLATSVLRKAEPKYAAIIHTGVNAQGETIVSPLDGIHLVPGSSPAHYVLVQHTTEDRRKLRGKWLTAKDADLTKAIAEATTIRNQLTDAKLTVVFCTNQRADVALVRDVTVEATKANVTADFWEQHRLADFLDNSGDGHWLRKQFLGIDAELLSEDLFRDLCRRSVGAYRGRVLPVSGDVISRETDREVIRATREGGVNLCLLNGSSGFGKSVTALQTLEQRLREKGFGLWLPPEWMQGSANLESALNGWLRHLHPTIEKRAGAAALEIASATGQKLLVVIDDVSRTDAPVKMLRTLISLAAPTPTETTTGTDGESTAASPESQAIILTPIWPEWFQHLANQILNAKWVRTVSIGVLTDAEGAVLITRAVPTLALAEATGFAERLANDPFAIGLFGSLCRGISDIHRLLSLAKDVIGEFVGAQLRELAATHENVLFIELKEAFIRLGVEMLRKRNIIPRWSDASRWFTGEPRILELLRMILAQGALARLVDEIVEFRHDRLRDRLLVWGMTHLMQEPTPTEEIVADPYFSGVTGQALAEEESLSRWIDRLRAIAPPALFDAMRHLGTPKNDHQRMIVDAARGWAVTESQSARSAVRWAVNWILVEADSPLVVEIAGSLPSNRVLSLAGLRNGSAKLGLGYFWYAPDGDFEPGTNDKLRDRIIDIARARRSSELSAELHEMMAAGELPKCPPHVALVLLGHLRLAGFDDEIMRIWRLNTTLLLRHAAVGRDPVPGAECCSDSGSDARLLGYYPQES